MTNDEIRAAVRAQYGKVAREAAPACAPGCCGGSTPDMSLRLGYSAEELAAVPEGANLGLGCGNPQALAALRDVTQRFPQTEYAADARLKIDMVNDQLAGKEMSVGRFYLRNGDTLAAIGRFQTVLQRYQTTTHTPEALYRLVEANLTLGLAEEAKRNGAVLGYNYPGDYWYGEAYSLLTSKDLKPAVLPDAKAKRGFQLPFSKDPAKTVPPAVAEVPRPPGAG
jgi:outer membrane protein assembly factor BamD